jgi:alpha-beta hydrolase superfamily lysophospholipase
LTESYGCPANLIGELHDIKRDVNGMKVLFVLIILYSLYLEYDSPLIPSASGLAGLMAELHSCYPSSPFDKRKHLKAIDTTHKKRDKEWDEITESPPALTPPPVTRWLLLLRPFGRKLPDISSHQEVHDRLIALLH